MNHLTLYIGIRYFGGSENVEPFDIKIIIDGNEVSYGKYPSSFSLKKPDQIIINLREGTHTLLVDSQTTDPNKFETTFEMPEGELFADLSYDYYPNDHVNYQKRGFYFETQKSDFGWR
jgi:hypothetical protein